MSEYKFDFHMHVPPWRIRETLAKAMLRGLNAIAFTDYDNTSAFDNLLKNNFQGEPILDPRGWKLLQIAEPVIRASKGEYYIDIIKGEEVKSQDGDILALGIKHPIIGGAPADWTLETIYQQNGIAVFPHLAASYFGGCGENLFRSVEGHFRGEPLALEVNAQFPELFSWNDTARKLGIEYNLPVFASSDIHGKHLWEHQKVGLRYHTSVHGIYSDNPLEDLKKAMKERPGSFREEGNANNLLETIAWNAHSFARNFPGKTKVTLNGLSRGFKLTF